MIDNPWLLLLVGTLFVVAVMFGLWLLGIRNRNFSYVDIGWSVNFAVLGRAVCAARAGLPATRAW